MVIKMSFVIEESFVKGKSLTGLCEDGWVATPDYVVVIDGATSKSDFRIDGVTTGRKAMEIISDEVQRLPSGISASEFVNIINERIIRYYKTNHILDLVEQFPETRLTASVAVYCHSRNEVWLIGDCQCKIGECCFKNNKKIDSILSELRSFVLCSALRDGSSIKELQKRDIGREFIYPMLKRQYLWQNNLDDNSEYRYIVLDGFPVDYALIRIIPVGDRSIVLATDGYFDLYGTLQETEQALCHQIETDPLCIGMGCDKNNKSTKGVLPGNCSFDDRTYVRISCF